MEQTIQNNIIPMPRIGDKAPSFKAVTTQGNINFPEDYSGNWVILFSHPADFTPVCTSEFMTFATMENQFEEANCKLVGLSVDGLYSHIAWLRTIKEKIEYKGEFGVAFWQTIEFGGLRIRLVEYSGGYLADHQCQKGHIVHCLEGEFISELENGDQFLLSKGMTYIVSDNLSSHRSIASKKVILLIIDGDFLK